MRCLLVYLQNKPSSVFELSKTILLNPVGLSPSAIFGSSLSKYIQSSTFVVGTR
jgi:hypothetical protein